MAKFTYNNHVHSSTQHTPFFVDTGQHPHMGFKPVQQPSKVKAVSEFTDHMEDTLSKACAALVKFKDDMTCYYNQHCRLAPIFAASDKVFLDASDICTMHPLKKLSHCFLGSFMVI